MGFHDLVRLKLRELEAPVFDESLSGAHCRELSKISSGFSLFDGQLMDLDGRVVHYWNSRYLGLILPNRCYVAQQHYESRKWGMYHWNGQPVWERDFPIHHDIVHTPQNTLLTLTKEMHFYKGRNVDFCAIVEMSLEGHELSRWSTWENLSKIQRHHKPLELDRPKFFFLPETNKRKEASPWGGHYDYYRLNSIQVIPENKLGQRDSRFQAGNWLISFRHGSMIFILDKDSREIVWKCIAHDVKGNLEGQHSPQMLSNGRVLIFDNGRYRGWSRVIEIDPVTYEILWEYRGDYFFTLSQGYAQRLDNGNTLITESEQGHAFEVTPDKEVVWEYYHPEKQNASNSLYPKNYGRRQWIYRMIRYNERSISA